MHKKATLSKLKAHEVSLVKRGAVKRPIFVLKNHEGAPMAESAPSNQFMLTPEQDAKANALIAKLAARVEKADGDPDESGLSDRAQAAMKAVYRILLPFKDEITNADLDALQDSIGMSEGGDDDSGVVVDEDGNEVGNDELVEQSADTTSKEDDMADTKDKDDKDVCKDASDAMDWGKIPKPADMSDEDHKAAMDAAKGAYKSKMKSKTTKSADSADGDEAGESDEPVSKSFDAVAKQYEENNRALIAKTADLEAQIRKMHDDRELLSIEEEVRKTYKNLSIDVAKTAKVLKSLKDADTDAHATYVETLKAADEQVRVSKSFGKAGLFGQMGQGAGSGVEGQYTATATSGAEAQLEALVEQHVGKGDCRTKADAWSAVLKTAKGAELYTQMAVEQNRGV